MRPTRLAPVLLGAALVLAGCSPSTVVEEEPPLATASPLEDDLLAGQEPTIEPMESLPDDDPAPTEPDPEPSATPDATSSPTAEPSPDPDPEPEPAPAGDGLDEDEALAAAEARAASRRECDAGFGGHEVIAEADGVLLVHVICFFGAYQPNGEVAVWDGDELRPLVVPQWTGDAVEDVPEVVGTVFQVDDRGGVGNEVRYRGLGDCGVLHTWAFESRELVLLQAREQDCSDDGEPRSPEEWPVVYER